MMQIKLFEIRDSGTFMPMMAIGLFAAPGSREFWLLRRAGYDEEAISRLTTGMELKCPTCEYTLGAELAEKLITEKRQISCPSPIHNEILQPVPGKKFFEGNPFVIFCKLDGVEAHYDPFDWPNQRTLGNAHRYIIDHWSELNSGQLIDVQFILGETASPKISEQYSEGG